jgi:hypothetical protein
LHTDIVRKDSQLISKRYYNHMTALTLRPILATRLFSAIGVLNKAGVPARLGAYLEVALPARRT